MTKLAEVKTIYKSNASDIVATLRLVADQMERGDFGELHEAALVHVTESGVHVHGLGNTTAPSTCMLLEMGKRLIVEDALQGYAP